MPMPARVLDERDHRRGGQDAARHVGHQIVDLDSERRVPRNPGAKDGRREVDHLAPARAVGAVASSGEREREYRQRREPRPSEPSPMGSTFKVRRISRAERFGSCLAVNLDLNQASQSTRHELLALKRRTPCPVAGAATRGFGRPRVNSACQAGPRGQQTASPEFIRRFADSKTGESAPDRLAVRLTTSRTSGVLLGDRPADPIGSVASIAGLGVDPRAAVPKIATQPIACWGRVQDVANQHGVIAGRRTRAPNAGSRAQRGEHRTARLALVPKSAGSASVPVAAPLGSPP